MKLMNSEPMHSRYALIFSGRPNLSLDKLWLFVANHPAQLELGDLMTSRGNTSIAKFVREEREVLEVRQRKLITEKWPDIAADRDDFPSLVLIEHCYNLMTDRGETLVSGILAFQTLTNIPGPQVGAIPTADLVVEGFKWKDIYPNSDGNYLNSKSAKSGAGKKLSRRSKRRSH